MTKKNLESETHAPAETHAYGVALLHGNHKKILPLKRRYKPTEHGHRVWPMSWLLIDYLEKTQWVANKRVLDVGCGWGLMGIYCAKEQGAVVTCADIDEAVGPYVETMAEANTTEVRYLPLGIDMLQRDFLQTVDVIISADICYSEDLIDSLRRLILRAKKAAVQHVLIADPGRWPFEDLCRLFARKKGVEIIEWRTHAPSDISGKILHIDNAVD